MLHAVAARLGVAAVVVAGAAVLAATPAAASGQVTVVLRTPGPIDEIAFDGRRAGWIELRRQEFCAMIVRGDVVTGGRAPRTGCRQSNTSTASTEFGPVALAGRRVVWAHSVGSHSELWSRLFAVRRYRQVAVRGWVAECGLGCIGTVLG